ncbi:MAG: hypothetical protein ABI833_05105 [Acidobacteriota bacterium]
MKAAAAGIILVLLGAYVIDNYRHARYPSGVLVSDSPYQSSIASGLPWKENGNQFTPLADFHLRARVLHTEPYWFDSGSPVSPLDLAVGWGPMSDQAVLDEITIRQGRRWYTWQPAHQRFPIANDEIVSHSANIHTIPSTSEIKKQLRNLREGDIAELDGYLVEVKTSNGGTWTSSLSRTDLGGGACELMWVRSVAVR